MELAGRRAAVVGLGVSHLALIRFLLGEGAEVVAFDRKPDAGGGDLPNVKTHLGPDYLRHLTGFELVCLTPGMPKTLPELERARAEGSLFTGEIPLFLELCSAAVLGITGSAGKTTTTSLVAATLQRCGQEVFLGGNIGWPLIEKVHRIPAGATVVLELSSFQLQLCRKSPHWGAVLNFSPNHLDVHRDIEEYAAAKRNIYLHQGASDWAVFNLDNPPMQGWSASAPGQLAAFSQEREVENGAFRRGEKIIVRAPGTEGVLPAGELKLPGKHNRENALAAAALCFLAGAPVEAIAESFRTFRGVEHRLELVTEQNDVCYYNDSIATTPDRTLAALDTIAAPIVLIAGGYDKGLDYAPLGPAINAKVRLLLLMGPTAGKIERSVRQAGGLKTTIVHCHDLTEAVYRAKREALPGEAVLLSPAAASFDQFRDYQERGWRFKEMVQAGSFGS